MKRVEVKSSFNKENNKEGPKFKVGDHLRISGYKNVFAKDYVKNTVPWTYIISDLNVGEIVGTF